MHETTAPLALFTGLVTAYALAPDLAAGRVFYRWLIRNGFPEGYQTLCKPCNCSKGRGERCQKDHSREGEQLAG